MHNLNEELLSSWIRLSLGIMNDKIVSDLPYNEALICHILYRQQHRKPHEPLTATDLCEKTRMLKSQMNRTLCSMEERGLIWRERSTDDKRLVYIHVNSAPDSPYMRQHAKIIEIVDGIIDRLGEDRIGEVIRTFNDIVDAAREVLQK